MHSPSAPADPCVSPVQVWPRLATDRQLRAVRLMAQLAFNLVVALADSAPKEPNYAVAPCHNEDPP